MMHKIMMVLAIVLVAVGGYFGYQRYMNQDNVRIQYNNSKSDCYGICSGSECNPSTGQCTIY